MKIAVSVVLWVLPKLREKILNAFHHGSKEMHLRLVKNGRK